MTLSLIKSFHILIKVALLIPEFFAKSVRAFFSRDIPTDNHQDLCKPEVGEHKDTLAIQAQVKYYVVVSSGQRNIRYRIEDLLSGRMDDNESCRSQPTQFGSQVGVVVRIASSFSYC